MSKNINVNPGNYKVAGRERQGEDVVTEVERQTYTRQRVQIEPKAGKNRHGPNPRATRGKDRGKA